MMNRGKIGSGTRKPGIAQLAMNTSNKIDKEISDQVNIPIAHLRFIIEHLFLPLKPPQEGDPYGSVHQENAALLRLVADAAMKYSFKAPSEEVQQRLSVIVKMLRTLEMIKSVGPLSKEEMKDAIRRMTVGDVIALHIASQNAGLILRYIGNEIIFESFEASANIHQVIGTSGRLRCSYPGPAIAVEAHKIKTTSFLEELTSFLSAMDIEQHLEHAMPIVHKGGDSVAEVRDTADPKFITGMLCGILRGIGRPVDGLKRFEKRIRDDVLWKDAYIPWRRSPLWLVLKVALQSTFQQQFEYGKQQYKAFMLYFLADVLDLARTAASTTAFTSDLLSIMSMKLARRLNKAGCTSLDASIINKVSKSVKSTSVLLGQRWSDTQSQNIRHVDWESSVLERREGTDISLKNSRPYLEKIRTGGITGDNSSCFKASCQARIAHHTDHSRLPNFKPDSLAEGECYLLLQDFEVWVRDHLAQWLAINNHRESGCKEVASYIAEYTKAALEAYTDSPENMSIMLLTAMELWVALDKIAVRHCPLLKEYTPEIPRTLLEPLLLPKKTHMEQLSRIEDHLRERYENISYRTHGEAIISDRLNTESFAVRYFDQSRALKELEEIIVARAEKERQEKECELLRRKSEYDSYIRQAGNHRCTGRISRRGYLYHDYSCTSCDLKKQAENIRISVHEWPLPENVLHKKFVLFELALPPAFAAWRDATYQILFCICKPDRDLLSDPDDQKCHGTLSSDDGLSHVFKDHGQQLSAGSKTKCWRKTHRRECSFPMSLDNLVKSNGLTYSLFDVTSRLWVEEQPSNARVLCTQQLPEGKYSFLQYAVDNSSHTANQVIANQWECPADLSLHEYEAFGYLRAGFRLQWLNIARELRARNLTFNREEVNILVSQAACQAGPASEEYPVRRESHSILADPSIGQTLLKEIERTWKNIENNWQQVTCAKMLITLTLRVLSLSTCIDTRKDAHRILRIARGVTLDWNRQLTLRLQEAENEKQMQDLRRRVLQTAAICRLTYDVESIDVGDIISSDVDVATAIECAISVYDNTPAATAGLPRPIMSLLEQNKRISSALEPVIRQAILESSSCMDQSLGKKWIGCKWSSLPEPNERWITTKTMAVGDRVSSMTIDLNLLDGNLLINGLPLRRLPPEFTAHPTYIRIFGQRIFDVNKSDLLGMQYQMNGHVAKHEVHFAMEDSELAIVTQKGSVIYKLVPHTNLLGDFPKHLVENYTHWFNLEENILEFRQLDDMWATPPKSWCMSYSEKSKMQLGTTKLVDFHSQAVAIVSKVFEGFEDAQFIEVTLTANNKLTVSLPRLQLEFFLNSAKEFESRQFRGFVIDKNQSFGTLIGLSDLLVLREGGLRHYYNRKVLIPYGRVSFWGDSDHVNVTIDTSEQEIVKYYSFDIDTKLGRLKGNATLTSHLYKIYLHAVTSHCQPDPLTGRTGTEEALFNLRAGATWSFQRLEDRDIELLVCIASLAPARTYYPGHLKVMQCVEWSNLPSLSQHEDFRLLVEDLLQHEKRFRMFQVVDRRKKKASEFKIELPKSEIELVKRTAVRHAVYRQYEYGGSWICEGVDEVYQSRDVANNCTLEAQVCSITSKTESWTHHIPAHDDLMTELLDSEQRIDTSSADGDVTISYQAKWLNVNLAKTWLGFYDAIRSCCEGSDKGRLTFFLATLVYSEKVTLPSIWTLLAVATTLDLKLLFTPSFVGNSGVPLDLQKGFEPDESTLLSAIRKEAIAFDDSPEAVGVDRWSPVEYDRQMKRNYEAKVDSQAQELVTMYSGQWPCSSPDISGWHRFGHIKVSASEKVRSLFMEWYRNRQFKLHIEEIQNKLDKIRTSKVHPTGYSFQRALPESQPPSWKYITLEKLLQQGAPLLPGPPEFPQLMENLGSAEVTEKEDLGSVIRELETKSTQEQENRHFQKDYFMDLRESLQSFKDCSVPLERLKYPRPEQLICGLNEIHEIYESYVRNTYKLIKNRLILPDLKDNIGALTAVGLWPHVTPISLLSRMAGQSAQVLTDPWKEALINYGKGITLLQQAERLYVLAFESEVEELAREARNKAHQGWDPLQRSDWLLFEIENNILIRPVQAELAAEMLSPPGNENSVYQLNMGEGKSSVIVPIVATAIANGDILSRVIVLKPLASQMFRLLVQKLGGLTNRRIYYAPFSRSISIDYSKAVQILELYQECMRLGGIFLMQPEHILSFKLMGLEELCREELEVANILLESQRWLETHVRDLLDESDELLAVKYQLTYTVGQQCPMELHPHRWVIIEQLLDLVQNRIEEVQKAFVEGVELIRHDRQSGFAGIRILDPEAGKLLIKLLIEDIFNDKHRSISFRLPPQLHKLARKFIEDQDISYESSQSLLEDVRIRGSQTQNELLLLRGLLSGEILLNALGAKRYRVDYGLDFSRSMLAVPYRAKDSPAPRAEFSHPDVIITLTCLSYYYKGLTPSQFNLCFEILNKLENPGLKYEQWLQEYRCHDVPLSLRELSGINLEDEKYREKVIFPLFRFNKAVIDFFMSNVVFPREAKQFPEKLTTSSWDLAESRSHATTGFSGTNDSRYLLPLSIKQKALLNQKGTNAKVLSFLLQPENNYYVYAGEESDRLCDFCLLTKIVKVNDPEPIRVIIDVGAQFLQMKNEEVAEKWLSLIGDEKVEAAVFFDDNDSLKVITQDGRTELLDLSPYLKQMDRTIVFLDDVHTRGTDLKFPLNYRAAVTLGPNLSKDKLVQASMRMRKLGQGQSVIFFAPPEIDRKIRECAKLRSEDTIEVAQVIQWVLLETCGSTEKSVPFWADQGLSYQNRKAAWEAYCKNHSDETNIQYLKKDLVEQEAQSLKELYAPKPPSTIANSVIFPAEEVTLIRERLQKFGYTSSDFRSVRHLEEQERELLHEAERERVVQRPEKALPRKHYLHPDVIEFVQSGLLYASSEAFIPAFQSLITTSTKNDMVPGWTNNLHVTEDFMETIVTVGTAKDNLDDFLRPVNWILSSRGGALVVVSPMEAHELLPYMKDAGGVRLHIFSAKVAKHMEGFDDLTFCTVPSSWRMNGKPGKLLLTQLTLFSGQVYLPDYKAYRELCELLGLSLSTDSDDRIHGDGFVMPEYRDVFDIGNSPFQKSPIPLLRNLISYRRKGTDYSETHLGRILQRRLLQEKDFL